MFFFQFLEDQTSILNTLCIDVGEKQMSCSILNMEEDLGCCRSVCQFNKQKMVDSTRINK